MAIYTYQSNISPMWPFATQEALLNGVASGAVAWRDDLSAANRRRHRPSLLAGRADMLRPSSRKTDLTIYVASLAVLAWTADDMLACLTDAMQRRATIHVLDAGLIIPPNAGPDVLHQAVKAFAAGRRSRLGMSAGKVGGKISGERRSAVAKAAAETVRAEWPLPSAAYPTADLIKRSGVSLNTLKVYLGRRSDAQRHYQAAQKRREKKEQKQ